MPAALPPPPGTVKVGELLVDAQTRAVWLGVAETMTPVQALLISDIENLQTQIDELRLYTESELALRAPLEHRHDISDIDGVGTGGGGGIGAGVMAFGVIMWAGTVLDIPESWALCDGLNGTPNLTGRFVLGGGSDTQPVHVTGGAWEAEYETDDAGSHNHNGKTLGTAITLKQMPSHNHDATDAGHEHELTDEGHTHEYNDTYPENTYTTGIGGSMAQWEVLNHPTQTDENVLSGITIEAASAVITVSHAGENEAHTHVIETGGLHFHKMTISNMPPFYALCYIMKLPTLGP